MEKRVGFEEFKKKVVEGIKDWLPEQFATANVSIQVITKNNNVKLTGLTITSEGTNISPTIYLEEFFDRYMEGADMTEILKRIADVRINNEVKVNFDVSDIIDLENCRCKILPRLIGAEWNKSLLENRPHILIEDLAVTFYINLGKCNSETMSIHISKDLMEQWGVKTEDLYEIAIKNLRDMDEGTFTPMKDIIAEMMIPMIMEECNGDILKAQQKFNEMMPEDDTMYVITNRDKINGACMLLDKNLMEKIINKLGTDIYIIPSSIHECIVISENINIKPEELENLVKEVNETQVSVEERLSEKIYKYTLEEGLKLA